MVGTVVLFSLALLFVCVIIIIIIITNVATVCVCFHEQRYAIVFVTFTLDLLQLLSFHVNQYFSPETL